LILSHHSRFTCEWNKEDINDDDDDQGTLSFTVKPYAFGVTDIVVSIWGREPKP